MPDKDKETEDKIKKALKEEAIKKVPLDKKLKDQPKETKEK